MIGSVVGPPPYHDMVTRFQAVISEEMKTQLMEKTGKSDPDYILTCIGGGSNAAGAFYHYLENEKVKLVAAEGGGLGLETNQHAASVNKGTIGVLHASTSLLIQTDDGQIVEPYSISAGLDYPGVGPQHAYLSQSGRAELLNATVYLTMQPGRELYK